jgi:hypothetical protein
MDNAHPEVLSLLIDIKGSVGELKADARNATASREHIMEMLKAHTEIDERVAERVTKLEHARSHVAGIIIGVSTIVSIATTAGVAIAKALL